MRTPRPSAFAVLLLVVSFVVLWSLPRLSTARALAIFTLLAASLALVALVRDVRRGDGPPGARRFEAALRRRPPAPSPPVELVRMQRELELGISGAAHAHRGLLPLLRSAAAARIATRHGFDLERRPDAARAVLGDDVWELLRPDRPVPADRHAPGVPRSRVAAAIERVEAL